MKKVRKYMNMWTKLASILFFLTSASAFSQSESDLIREYQFNEFRNFTSATLQTDFQNITKTTSKLSYTGGSKSGCLAFTEQLPFQVSSNAAVMGTATVSVKVYDYVVHPGFCPSCPPRGCVVRPECEPAQYSPTASAYQFRVEVIAMAADGTRYVKTHGINNSPSLFTGKQSFSSAELVVPALRLAKQIAWVQMRICDVQATDNGTQAKLDISVENLELAKFWD